MSNIEDKICNSINIIAKRLVDRAKYDKVVKGKIAIESVSDGINYRVKVGNVFYKAVSIGGKIYQNGDMVYLLIPQNDNKNTKFILGKEDDYLIPNPKKVESEYAFRKYYYDDRIILNSDNPNGLENTGQYSASIGENSMAAAQNSYSFGKNNIINLGSVGSSILGGQNNYMSTSFNSAIIGGADNSISGGGYFNIISNSNKSTIKETYFSNIYGGNSNTIQNGYSNYILNSTQSTIENGNICAIYGGQLNSILGDIAFSHILGSDNSLSGNSAFVNIVGDGNTVTNTNLQGSYIYVIGGQNTLEDAGYATHISGDGNSASTCTFSEAFGHNNTIYNGQFLTTVGHGNSLLNGTQNYVFGNGNTTKEQASYNVILGMDNEAAGLYYSTILGSQIKNNAAAYNLLFGNDISYINGPYNLALGKSIGGMNGQSNYMIGSYISNIAGQNNNIFGQNISNITGAYNNVLGQNISGSTEGSMAQNNIIGYNISNIQNVSNTSILGNGYISCNQIQSSLILSSNGSISMGNSYENIIIGSDSTISNGSHNLSIGLGTYTNSIVGDNQSVNYNVALGSGIEIEDKEYTYCLGYGLSPSNDNHFVIGYYNEDVQNSDCLLTIGMGNDSYDRKNALSIIRPGANETKAKLDGENLNAEFNEVSVIENIKTSILEDFTPILEKMLLRGIFEKNDLIYNLEADNVNSSLTIENLETNQNIKKVDLLEGLFPTAANVYVLDNNIPIMSYNSSKIYIEKTSEIVDSEEVIHYHLHISIPHPSLIDNINNDKDIIIEVKGYNNN